MNRVNLSRLLGAILSCELVGILATPFTISAIPTWYASLHKPFFSPPNWIFGPVWTILYALMGVSVYLILMQTGKKIRKTQALRLFTIQLLLNFLWSLLFFGLHSPILGLVDIIAMWIFIVLTIKTFYAISRVAGYLLIPYLLWVSFALLLNASIFVLNR
jgi:tryptophan-rich sensory protein